MKSSLGEGTPASTIQEPDLGRVFDVASFGKLLTYSYCFEKIFNKFVRIIAGNFVYAINGPTSPLIPIRGFTIDPRTEQIIDHWGSFENPHTIAICPNGSAMYVGEIGPNRLTKFILEEQVAPN